MDELRSRINNLASFDEYTLGSLLSDINVHGNGEKDDEVYELFNLFVKRVHDYLVNQVENGFLTTDEAVKEADNVRELANYYMEFRAKDIRDVFRDNALDKRSIMNIVRKESSDSIGKGELNMEDLNQRIDSFISYDDIDNDTLINTINEVKNLSNDDEREKIYGALTDKVASILLNEVVNGSLTNDDYVNKVLNFKDSLLTYAGFSNTSVDNLFESHGLATTFSELSLEEEKKLEINKNDDANTINNISGDGVQTQDADDKLTQKASVVGDSDMNVNISKDDDDGKKNMASANTEREKNEEELTQEEIKKEIAELEAELSDVFTDAKAVNMAPRDYLNAEIKKIEEEKSERIKSIDEQLDAIMLSLSKNGNFDILTDQELKKLVMKYEAEIKKGIIIDGQYDKKKVNRFNIYIKGLDEIKNVLEVRKVNPNFEVMTVQELQRLSLKYESEIKKGAVIDGQYDKERVNYLNNCKKNLDEIKKVLEYRKNNPNFKIMTNEELEKLSLDYELEIKKGAIVDGQYDKEKVNRLNICKKNLDEIKKVLEDRKNNPNFKIMTNGELERLSSVYESGIKKVAILNGKNVKGRADYLSNYKKNLDEIKKVLDSRKNNLNWFNEMSLDEQKALLYKLRKSSQTLQSKYDKEVSKLQDKLNKINRLEELNKKTSRLEELNKKINNIDKIDKVDKTQGKSKKRWDLFYKGLAGVSGFAIGMGMSCIPGVGAIRMGVAATKLATSGINLWTKKHPEGKIAKVIDGANAKFNNFEKNHPKLVSAVDCARKIINNPYTNCFINGMAIGYIAGNIFEMVTGKAVSEYIKPKTAPAPVSVPPQQAATIAPVKPQVPVPTSVSTGFNIGDGGIDVSGMMGYTDSFGNSLTTLDQSLASSVKIVGENNGMYLLQSLDGDPFAWMPKDAVDALKTAAEVAAKTR